MIVNVVRFRQWFLFLEFAKRSIQILTQNWSTPKSKSVVFDYFIDYYYFFRILLKQLEHIEHQYKHDNFHFSLFPP